MGLYIAEHDNATNHNRMFVCPFIRPDVRSSHNLSKNLGILRRLILQNKPRPLLVSQNGLFEKKNT